MPLNLIEERMEVGGGEKGGGCKGRTEKRNTRRIRKMQTLAVLAKVLGTPHQLAHLLEDRNGACGDLVPRALQAMDGCRAEG